MQEKAKIAAKSRASALERGFFICYPPQEFFTILTDIGRKIKMQKGRYAKRRTVLYSIDQNLLFTHAEAGEDLVDHGVGGFFARQLQ